jgi:two-component system nitrogen regulation response regulator GlnG
MDAQTGILGTDGTQRVVVRRVLVRVTAGPDRGVEKRLDGGTLSIGTSQDADLVLRDPTVSRMHAELSLLVSGVRVKDLGSTNGTFVGESRIESVVVPAGSEFRVGKTRLELLAADVPLPDAPSERVRFGRLVGASAPMRKVFGQLERLAVADVPVWIWGEAGTGKTEAAHALHEASARARQRLVIVDLDPAHPAHHVTAAFQAALGGTLLLDRVDEASVLQLDAIRTLLDRAEREGAQRKAEEGQGEHGVRFVATSRRDPRSAVEAGLLSRDLFFHLAGARVEMPPLRDRLEDLPRLVDALVEELGYPGLRLSAAELAQLRAQDLSGNVRQLRRLIEEALLRSASRPSAPPPPGGEMVTVELNQLPFKEAKEKLLDTFEAQYVAQLLERAGGNVSRAADEAGIDRNHLARLAKKHGLR